MKCHLFFICIYMKLLCSNEGKTFLVLSISWGFWVRLSFCFELFHEGGRYHIETSQLICSASQWTGFYIITASVMKELSLHMSKKVLFQKICVGTFSVKLRTLLYIWNLWQLKTVTNFHKKLDLKCLTLLCIRLCFVIP